MPTTRLPEATREAQLARHGLHEHTGGLSAKARRGTLADDAPEPHDDVTHDARGFLADGGWHVVDGSKGTGRGGGTTSHRGVLHPDEYLDHDTLSEAVAQRLGFALADIEAAYRPGRPVRRVLALRTLIDARILEVEQGGGRMVELARALGWHVKPNGSCKTLDNALARARATA